MSCVLGFVDDGGPTHPSQVSHHLRWSQDIWGVMLIPGSKAVAVATGGQGPCLGQIPEGWKGRGAGRQGEGSPREVPFLSSRALLQELLVFGAFVLKPDLYLGREEGKEEKMRSVWGEGGEPGKGTQRCSPGSGAEAGDTLQSSRVPEVAGGPAPELVASSPGLGALFYLHRRLPAQTHLLTQSPNP